MQKICPECRGSGKVESADYREPTALPEAHDAWWKMTWRNCSGTFWRVVVCLIAVGVFGAIGTWCDRVMKEDTLNCGYREQWLRKMGYVVVQYDAGGAVVRCWVTPPDDAKWPNGPLMPIHAPEHLGWVEVPDRNDVAGFARKLGVVDPSTCSREF